MKLLQHLLLADDNDFDIELTLEALKEYGLDERVVVVKDGVEVLEYLRCEGKYAERKSGLPAILLLDIKMPRMDGLQVLEEIRKDDKLALLPVIMLTSSKEDSDLLKSYELGTNAYIVKPVGFNNFIDVVKHISLFWTKLNQVPDELEQLNQ